MGARAHLMNDGKLWVRNGLSGLNAERDNVAIDIDDDLIRDLMADTMRSKLISKLEQMETDEIFKYFGIGD